MPVVTPTLVSAGSKMPATYQILSIDIQKEVDRIPQAEIRVIEAYHLSKVYSRGGQDVRVLDGLDTGVGERLQARLADGQLSLQVQAVHPAGSTTD